MNDHNDISREKLNELLEYNRRKHRSRDPRQRPGVEHSIRTARSTLLINLIIEIVAGLILMGGIAYTVSFLYHNRELIEPGKFRLYLQVLGFFTVGWLTYFGYKVRAKYLALKNHGKPRENNRNGTA